jgi:hypothetical protein
MSGLVRWPVAVLVYLGREGAQHRADAVSEAAVQQVWFAWPRYRAAPTAVRRRSRGAATWRLTGGIAHTQPPCGKSEGYADRPCSSTTWRRDLDPLRRQLNPDHRSQTPSGRVPDTRNPVYEVKNRPSASAVRNSSDQRSASLRLITPVSAS